MIPDMIPTSLLYLSLILKFAQSFQTVFLYFIMPCTLLKARHDVLDKWRCGK